ncbi:hypothetical protein [Cupriavidus sp. BIC8F]|nr:hypothetical protein [Cupriavidus sp. BIC8F]
MMIMVVVVVVVVMVVIMPAMPVGGAIVRVGSVILRKCVLR